MNGVPELLILQLLDRREMSGYELVQSIREKSNDAINLSEGVVYPTLHALELEGALKSRRKVVGGRSRIYYSVTKTGSRKLERIAAACSGLTQAVQSVLGGAERAGTNRRSRGSPASRGSGSASRVALSGVLSEHFDDLVAEELSAGRNPKAAERAALGRLGHIDSLARHMIARKEFASWSHRAPALVYLLAPFGEWIGVGLSILVPFGIVMK